MIGRIRRWWDRRRSTYPVITGYQWALMQNSMEYRDSHYWQINRGRG